MFKRVKRFLETTEGKLKAIILTTGFIIIMVALSAGAIVFTNQPTFCKSCHEMNPEYYTWVNSAHSKVACVTCHVKPGLINTLVHKVAALKDEVYPHFTGYETPITISEKVENSQCEQCHDMSKRVTTPSGDLKFDHTKHLNQKLDCVTCHAGVAHGQIEENGFTAQTNFDSWNSEVGKQYVNSPVSRNYTNLQMSQCIDCHTDKNAPVTCNTCHSKMVAPDSHKASTWVPSTHGKLAAQDFTACDKCHSLTSAYQGVIPKETTAADYARNNTFCNTCHTQKPAGHTDAWKKGHQYAAKNNRSQCLVCHNDSGKRPGDNSPSNVTCMDCHTQTHKNLILSIHPYKIPPSGFGAECAKCHKITSCEACHGKA